MKPKFVEYPNAVVCRTYNKRFKIIETLDHPGHIGELIYAIEITKVAEKPYTCTHCFKRGKLTTDAIYLTKESLANLGFLIDRLKQTNKIP